MGIITFYKRLHIYGIWHSKSKYTIFQEIGSKKFCLRLFYQLQGCFISYLIVHHLRLHMYSICMLHVFFFLQVYREMIHCSILCFILLQLRLHFFEHNVDVEHFCKRPLVALFCALLFCENSRTNKN